MDSINLDETFWNQRYDTNETGWDIGYPSTPLKTYIDQIRDKKLSILIPGAGNAYEAIYLVENGFTDVTVCDISAMPLENLYKYSTINTIHGDFFNLKGSYDIILEQTFFCALNPALRKQYVEKMYHLLNHRGKLVGVLFDRIFDKEGPPFGGSKNEYESLFSPYFDFHTFDSCNNSIAPRAGNEIFINLIKK